MVGVDSYDPYYDVGFKRERVAELAGSVELMEVDLAQPEQVDEVFEQHRPQVVVHLAAQAGIRNSLENPQSYIQSNLVGFGSVLEACRHHRPDHLVYASSSSVYGSTSPTPFSVGDPADQPLNLYAATKRSNELMAHAYSQLFDLPTTGLRFFTVYGPWGRPDMAYFSFAEAMRQGRPVTVFGDGTAARDFTYVDDIVDGVVATALRPPRGATQAEPTDWGNSPIAPWRVHNIGHGEMVSVNELLDGLERHLPLRLIRETGDSSRARHL